MFCSQTKLSKAEWEKCEIPVSQEEKSILQMIVDGYRNIHISRNNSISLCSYLKIENTEQNELYLYVKYFQSKVEKVIRAGGIQDPTEIAEFKRKFCHFSVDKKMKKMDIIRFQNTDKQVAKDQEKLDSLLFEFILLDLCEKALLPTATSKTRNCSLYSLMHMKKAHVIHTNRYVKDFTVDLIHYIERKQGDALYDLVLTNAASCIEKNPLLFKYENQTLYSHQKHLFQFFHAHPDQSKLVFYTSPTGTGKTLSPLGLSAEYRIIYICASRHVALSLAKNAISVQKKIAFAFGCKTEDDIRLHQYAAKKYEINKRTGGIGRIDNSKGENVEIMISDLSSYLIAMYYMMEFHTLQNLVLYWDEPTISLDYDNHPLHSIIRENWQKNEIPNVVLSSATLPHETEIYPILHEFAAKFEGVKYATISSDDCKKTITLINKDQYAMLPHLYFQEYTQIKLCVEHCLKHATLIRYIDFREVLRFLNDEVIRSNLLDEYKLPNYFANIAEMAVDSIKKYYLHILSSFEPLVWEQKIRPIIRRVRDTQKSYWDMTEEKKSGTSTLPVRRIHSVDATTLARSSIPLQKSISMQEPMHTRAVSGTGSSAAPHSHVLLTTTDAHTLTDGVTIFFAEDVDKVGAFMLQTSQIPVRMIEDIENKIRENMATELKLKEMEKTMEDKIGKDSCKERKMERQQTSVMEATANTEITRLMLGIESLQTQLHNITLEPRYIPNTVPHQRIWRSETDIVPNAYIPDVGPDITQRVLALQNISLHKKILLLLGIGVFHNVNEDVEHGEYMEIMKELCESQKLYLIIAHTDFIYGLNYQLCHEFFGKDVMTQMTQQKFIQACGRVGRGNVQKEYTVRIREDTIFEKMFLPAPENKEAAKMNELFCGGATFVEYSRPANNTATTPTATTTASIEATQTR